MLRSSTTTLGAIALVSAAALIPAAAGAKGSAGYHDGIAFESEDGRFSVNLGSRVQVRFTQTDPDVGDGSGSFDIRRAKIWLKGKVYGDWKYKIQAVWSGDATELEDAYFQYAKNRWAQPWVGQGKAFFGRQQLTSSGSQQFVERAITDGEFVPARTQGLALVGQSKGKTFEYNVGVYDDFDGQNVRANTDDNYMLTGRVVFTPLGEYALAESALDYPDSSKLAIGVKALTDTIAMGAGVEEDNTTVGVEVAYKIRGFNLVGEYFDRSLETDGLPDTDSNGGYLQAAYLFGNRKAEVAGRYALISPDVSGPSADRTETGVAFSWYFHEHDYKIQTDYRQLEFDADPTLDTDEIRAQLQFIF